MSATTRTRHDGSEYQRSPIDYYKTPAWCTKAILPYLPPARSPTFVALDAGAGDGAIADELPYGKRTRCVENDPALAEACREKGYQVYETDFLTDKDMLTRRTVDVVVMNPPFSKAQEFIERALLLTKGGVVAVLLRINFMEGQARAPFHLINPGHILVLPRRPSFTGGGTDATGYCWLMFGSNPGATLPIIANRWDIARLEPHKRGSS